MGFLSNLVNSVVDAATHPLDLGRASEAWRASDPILSSAGTAIMSAEDKALSKIWGGLGNNELAGFFASDSQDPGSALTHRGLAGAAYFGGSALAGAGATGGASGGATAAAGAGSAAGGSSGLFGAGGVLGAGSIGKYAAAGLPILSSALQAQYSKSALDNARQAAGQSDATQRYFYDTSRADQMPFLLTGYGANDQINNMLANGAFNTPTFDQYQKDPSYDWQQSEAARIGQNTAAARNGLYRGSTAKALQDRAQNIANADYGNWWSRQQQGATNKVNMLNAIRTGGQTAAGAIGGYGQDAANQISASQAGVGDAAAANALAQGNIIGGALNRVSSYFGGAPSTAKSPYKTMWDGNAFGNSNGLA